MEIVGFPDYLIYEDGRVYSKKRNKFMKLHKKTNGYLAVEISGKIKYIHRLLAEHYIPNPENKATVDHINRNRIDNRLENLRWATHKEQRENQKIYKIRSDNKSGHRHIQYCNYYKKWTFRRVLNGKKYQRYFHTKIDALCYKFYFLLSHRKYLFG